MLSGWRQEAAALVCERPALSVPGEQLHQALPVGPGEGLQLPQVALLLLGTDRLQGDRDGDLWNRFCPQFRERTYGGE